MIYETNLTKNIGILNLDLDLFQNLYYIIIPKIVEYVLMIKFEYT